MGKSLHSHDEVALSGATLGPGGHRPGPRKDIERILLFAIFVEISLLIYLNINSKRNIADAKEYNRR